MGTAHQFGTDQATAASSASTCQASEFEPIAKSPQCKYCREGGGSAAFAPFFDAVYCLSLREQPHRTAAMADLLHRLGLCAECHVLASQPRQTSSRAIWKNHRDIARHAIDRGFRKVLIFEDDAHIRIDGRRLQARLREAMARFAGRLVGPVPRPRPVTGLSDRLPPPAGALRRVARLHRFGTVAVLARRQRTYGSGGAGLSDDREFDRRRPGEPARHVRDVSDGRDATVHQRLSRRSEARQIRSSAKLDRHDDRYRTF